MFATELAVKLVFPLTTVLFVIVFTTVLFVFVFTTVLFVVVFATVLLDTVVFVEGFTGTSCSLTTIGTLASAVSISVSPSEQLISLTVT